MKKTFVKDREVHPRLGQQSFEIALYQHKTVYYNNITSINIGIGIKGKFSGQNQLKIQN